MVNSKKIKTTSLIPKQWPGALGAFNEVKPLVKPQIWNLISTIGVAVIFLLIAQIILTAIFKRGLANTAIGELVDVIIGGFLQAAVITIYFRALKEQHIELGEALKIGLNKLPQMAVLLFIMDTVLLVSFVLLVIPFFFILPRTYLAPYYLIYKDQNVGQALASSWHNSRGNIGKFYTIFGLNIAIALLAITIIGIPFAIYWGLINSGSFALLTMYSDKYQQN